MRTPPFSFQKCPTRRLVENSFEICIETNTAAQEVGTFGLRKTSVPLPQPINQSKAATPEATSVVLPLGTRSFGTEERGTCKATEKTFLEMVQTVMKTNQPIFQRKQHLFISRSRQRRKNKLNCSLYCASKPVS